jgi:hypothetical protein
LFKEVPVPIYRCGRSIEMFLLAWQKNSHQYTGLRNIRNRRSFVDLPSLPRCASMKMGDRRLARASPREGTGYPLSPRPSPALVGQPSAVGGSPFFRPPTASLGRPRPREDHFPRLVSRQLPNHPGRDARHLSAPARGRPYRWWPRTPGGLGSTLVGQSRPLYLEPGFPALRGVWARPRLPGK